MLSICPHLAINTPFVNNNDGARLQMSSSQARQAVALLHNETPMVQTTLETSWIFEPDVMRSKEDGKIVLLTDKVIVIKYETGTWELLRIFYDTKVKNGITVGSKVSKDEVLAFKSNYFNDDGCLSQGKNLLVAIMSHPDTYEDAIILSKSFVEKGLLDSYTYYTVEEYLSETDILLSINKGGVYKALPSIGDIIKSGDPILRIKHYSKSMDKLLYPSKDITAIQDAEIMQVDVVPHKYNTSIREFAIKMKEYHYFTKEMQKYLSSLQIPQELMFKLKTIHYLYDYDKIIQDNKKPLGVFIKIVYRVIERATAGDKFSNRHANKGVVSKLLEDKYMPKLPDGRIANVIVNPLSIISRMNIGQLYEMSAANCIYKIRQIVQDAEQTNLDEIKSKIKSFYTIIDNTETKWISKNIETVMHNVKNIEQLKSIDYVFPAPPFESTSLEQLKQARELLGLEEVQEVEYRGKKVHVNIGYMYFYRLMHIASHKFAGRSIGSFSSKTHQPVSGKQKGGGQKMGEMEIWALVSYDAIENLKEVLSIKSDNIEQKLSFIYKTLYDIKGNIKVNDLESFKLLQAYLAILGVHYED